MYAVVFHPDGIHLLGGGNDGIQQWSLADGQEVGRQTEMQLRAISVSRNHQWIVCGTSSGASVWDAGLREKVVVVEGTNVVYAVDVSPDSTRFATGTGLEEASIWSISSGKRLVGPLMGRHDGDVTGIKFSPNGEHVATACKESAIHIFDSHTGDELMSIETTSPSRRINTPLAWSNDGQRIFAASQHNNIRSFDVSTGSQLAEMQIPNDGTTVESIALANNGKFLATYAGSTISFLDAGTLTRIGPVIKDSANIYSIALSPDSNALATGRYGAKISMRTLGHILPDIYGPFHVSIWPPFCRPH